MRSRMLLLTHPLGFYGLRRRISSPDAVRSGFMVGSRTDEGLTVDSQLRSMKSQQRPAIFPEFHRTTPFRGHWL